MGLEGLQAAVTRGFFSNLPALPGRLPVNGPPDPPRIAIVQLRWQQRLREILVGDRSREPTDGRGAD